MCVLNEFWNGRKQNFQHFSWVNIKAASLQGSVNNTLLCLIHVNGLPENILSNPNLFFAIRSNINRSLA